MKCIPLKYLWLVSCVLALCSCKRDMFDADAYKTILTESFPVDNIDPNHTWNLTKTYSIVVTANVDTQQEPTCVRILNGNHYTPEITEILAEASVERNQTVELFFSAPLYQQHFYAAVVTADGQYVLKAFTPGQQSVSFDSGTITDTDQLNTLIYQTYTYCYEADYPQPGDWDFNDLVLRIQKLPVQNGNELRLRVTLAAVGCEKQVAAAIRLLDYNYDDVEWVAIEEGGTFDNGLNVKRTLITKADLLLQGLHGEAVLNLFEDAHYALSPRLSSPDTGSMPIHAYYNTSHTPDDNTHIQLDPKTLTYVVKLKNPRLINSFTLENIDPFVVEDFNSGKWEIHTFSHKSDQILHNLGLNETATSNNMTWALKIPSPTFRYPIEGQSVGTFKNGKLRGAYMAKDHSYGQWVTNHDSSIDWFFYPTAGLIF